MDYENELKNFFKKDQHEVHESSGSTNMYVGIERFKCAELLFQPGLFGTIGIQDAVHMNQ